MLKDLLIEYGAPLAVSLTLAVGGIAISTSERVAVIETENKNMLTIQRELVHEMKEMNRIIYRIDAKLETPNE